MRFSGAKSIKVDEVQVLKVQTFRRFEVSTMVLLDPKDNRISNHVIFLSLPTGWIFKGSDPLCTRTLATNKKIKAVLLLRLFQIHNMAATSIKVHLLLL
ncbi:MAG: hypothetical protein AAF135_25785, partial [Bacteroidota bacterium]